MQCKRDRNLKAYSSIYLSIILFTAVFTHRLASANPPKHDTEKRTISSYGSDTLANLMHFWVQDYQSQHPKVKFKLHSEGSVTAVNKLINKQAHLGPMSRLMSEEERQAFKSTFGYYPTAIKVAMDALAIFVNKDNPLTSISLPQLDATFSKTRKCGELKTIDSWHQLGLKDDWQDKKIQLVGRNKVSGTYGFFKKIALCNGQFKPQVSNHPGSTSLIQMISYNRYALGFSGLGFKTAGVRAVPIRSATEQLIEATPEQVQAQNYPLARFLYIYINKPPHIALDEDIQRFLLMVLSEQGQQVVVQDGYIPLSKVVQQQQLSLL